MEKQTRPPEKIRRGQKREVEKRKGEKKGQEQENTRKQTKIASQ